MTSVHLTDLFPLCSVLTGCSQNAGARAPLTSRNSILPEVWALYMQAVSEQVGSGNHSEKVRGKLTKSISQAHPESLSFAFLRTCGRPSCLVHVHCCWAFAVEPRAKQTMHEVCKSCSVPTSPVTPVSPATPVTPASRDPCIPCSLGAWLFPSLHCKLNSRSAYHSLSSVQSLPTWNVLVLLITSRPRALMTSRSSLSTSSYSRCMSDRPKSGRCQGGMRHLV